MSIGDGFGFVLYLNKQIGPHGTFVVDVAQRGKLMKKIILLLIFFLSCNFRTGYETKENGIDGMYTFQAIDDNNKFAWSSKLMNVHDGFSANYGEQCALFQGRLLNLFGEPLYETPNIENQYSYTIQATDGDGKVFYLDVYSGPTGPAIGGDGSVSGIYEVAERLIKEISAASPSDFHYDGYYPDAPSKISMGVRDGEAYYSEEHITDANEIKRMYELIYGQE